MTIVERIYRGETAGQIGLSENDYASRRRLLDRYLSTGQSFSVATYLDWLVNEPEGDRLAASCSEAHIEWTSGGPSRGLGDTVAKLTHATGLDKLAHLYTQVTGKDCGCKGRQEKLNRLIPYGRN